MLVKLVCPGCKKALRPTDSCWRCEPCRRDFPYRRGVLSFVSTDEVFNESPFEHEQKHDWTATAQLRDRIRHSRLLSLINRLRIRISLSGRRDRIFYEELRGGDKQRLILDLGCGGGRHYFADYGRVVGIDPVLELLQISRQIYAEVYHGSALALPFADGSFDYVVSSDVIGHIPAPDKDVLFAEMHRVLRPGGRAVHVIETDATNRWWEFARQSPELFRKYFVDRPGHIGLERPTQLRERFRKHGFREIRFRRMAASVWECGMLAAMFDNEFRTRPGFPWLAVALDWLFSRNLALSEAANVVLELLAKVDDALSPLDHASGALVVFEK
jgi:SAM-dependent methyltransferase